MTEALLAKKNLRTHDHNCIQGPSARSKAKGHNARSNSKNQETAGEEEDDSAGTAIVPNDEKDIGEMDPEAIYANETIDEVLRH